MPTEKPRISVTIDKKTLKKFEAYQKENGIKTLSKVILTLAKFGLSELEWGVKHGNLTPYSDGAINLAHAYDGLDKHGRKILWLVANEELARCKALPIPETLLASLDSDDELNLMAYIQFKDK